jgi:hypothetical protein
MSRIRPGRVPIAAPEPGRSTMRRAGSCVMCGDDVELRRGTFIHRADHRVQPIEGRCATCHRGLKARRGVVGHLWDHDAEIASAGPVSWDELEAAGLCECGRRLAGHPPLVKPEPLQSWHAATSPARCVRLGISSESGVAQAVAWRAARAKTSPALNGAPGVLPGRSVVLKRRSGHGTRRTAPPVGRARP